MSGQNTIGPLGIQIQTLADIIDEIVNGSVLVPGFATIFPNAVTDPNSPDGNLINIVAQAKIDMLEFIVACANSFDPDQALGSVLDSRCSINGIVRQPGSYTQQNVSVTVSQGLTLPGIDTAPNAPFTVADAQGNQYQLLATHTFSGAGTTSLAFEAALLGPIQSAVSAITVIVTPQVGVTSVTNPAGPTSVGVNEETDAALRIRRANSVALPSIGYLGGMLGAIEAVPGVVQALCLENDSSASNSYGMPPYSTWFIVQCPSSAYAAVAAAIYSKRIAGPPQTNSGKGGAGTASVSAGGVTGISVASGGSGYANPPTVKLTGGGGTGATATAMIVNGVITSVVVTSGGTGYTSAPSVSFSGGSGSGATATATVSGGAVTAVNLTAGGTNYTFPISVNFSGGGGSGAAATAGISNGVISAFTVGAAGTGYTSAPTVVLNPNTIETDITQLDSTIFPIYFDIPIPQNLYFCAQVDAIDSSNPIPALGTIATALAGALSYKIGQKADASEISAILKELFPAAYVTTPQVSLDNSTWVSLVAPTSINYQFSIPVGNITLTS